MKIYNSLTRKKEQFKALRTGQVGMYSCGPTVYDKIHIGNLRAFITADLLQRSLRHLDGFALDWVMNITDIDDKIIARLARDYPGLAPEQARARLTEHFTKVFLQDIARVGIDQDDLTIVSAVDSIASMQQMIGALYKQGIAYASEGSIYFSVERYQASGQKYGRLVDLDYSAEARVTDDQDQKEGVADFALWKAQKVGEPAWQFRLDGEDLPGRPGWHIECSAMSVGALGQPFDIHTGGVDLKFPHHENEIAQAGGQLAHYFVHNEFLKVDSAKMSKSLNNFLTLDDVADPLAFRLFCLQGHYRKQLDYTAEAMSSAHNRLCALRQATAKNQYATVCGVDLSVRPAMVRAFRHNFAGAIADDLNTPLALAALAEFEHEGAMVAGFTEQIAWADQILGLGLVSEVVPFNNEEQALMVERKQARAQGNFSTSDQVRDRLAELGIAVEDLSGTSLYWRLS